VDIPEKPMMWAQHARGVPVHMADARTLYGIVRPCPAQAAALKGYGLHTAGLLASMDESVVCRILGGKAARILRDRARGIDPRTVTAGCLPESASFVEAEWWSAA
jgi:DNA polymerase-4